MGMTTEDFEAMKKVDEEMRASKYVLASNKESYDGKEVEQTEEFDLEEFKRKIAGELAAANSANKEDKKRFGVIGNRTKEQLANLVLEYGFEKVCYYEGVTPAQLRKKLNGSATDQLKEKFRQQRLAKLKGE